MPTVEVSRDSETGSGAGVADEVEDFGVTVERLGGLVFRDFGEQAALDGIPFGSAAGVMSNRYREPKTVAELALQFGLPSASAATIASAGIGKDEQLSAAMVAVRAVTLPPTGNGVGGEGCCVMRDADEDQASVGEPVIDAIRDRDADGIGTEIVIIDAHGRAIPLDTVVFEIADQFSFFGIDADDGKTLSLKAGT